VSLKKRSHVSVVVDSEFTGLFGSAAALCIPLNRRLGADSTPKEPCSLANRRLSKPVLVGQG